MCDAYQRTKIRWARLLRPREPHFPRQVRLDGFRSAGMCSMAR
jgi:hypothetical protein